MEGHRKFLVAFENRRKLLTLLLKLSSARAGENSQQHGFLVPLAPTEEQAKELGGQSSIPKIGAMKYKRLI